MPLQFGEVPIRIYFDCPIGILVGVTMGVTLVVARGVTVCVAMVTAVLNSRAIGRLSSRNKVSVFDIRRPAHMQLDIIWQRVLHKREQFFVQHFRAGSVRQGFESDVFYVVLMKVLLVGGQTAGYGLETNGIRAGFRHDEQDDEIGGTLQGDD